MKIAHVSWSMTNGGIENMLSDIINCQVGIYDVSLIIINDYVDESILNRIDGRCHIIRIGRRLGSKNPWFAVKLNYVLWKGHYDILHIHNHGFLKYLLYKGKRIATIHNSGFSSFKYSGCEVLACISKAVYDEMLQAGHKGCVRVDNGINVEAIRQRKNGWGSNVFRMVQVSRLLVEQKGQDILLKALSSLKMHVMEGFSLDYLGGGPDESMLRNLCFELGLNDHIRFLGNRDREYIYSHLKDYDLFVQPSRFEGFGLTVVEAMAARVPVLISDNEGPLDVIGYGTYGYSFKNGDIDDCARNIVLFMHRNNDLAMVEAAYQRALSNYDVRVTVDKYRSIYEQMLGGY